MQDKHKCEVCDKTFRFKGGLKTHLETFHEDVKKAECLICDKSYYNSYKLRQHIDAVHPSYKYRCDICEKCFKTITPFKIHMRDIHHYNESIKKKEVFSCDICERSFKRLKSLKNHIHHMHFNNPKATV